LSYQWHAGGVMFVNSSHAIDLVFKTWSLNRSRKLDALNIALNKFYIRIVVHDFHDFLAFVQFFCVLRKLSKICFYLIYIKWSFFKYCSSKGNLSKAQLGKLAYSCARDCYFLYNRFCVSLSSALYLNVHVSFKYSI